MMRRRGRSPSLGGTPLAAPGDPRVRPPAGPGLGWELSAGLGLGAVLPGAGEACAVVEGSAVCPLGAPTGGREAGLHGWDVGLSDRLAAVLVSCRAVWVVWELAKVSRGESWGLSGVGCFGGWVLGGCCVRGRLAEGGDSCVGCSCPPLRRRGPGAAHRKLCTWDGR